jgi:hypothetical protein
MSFLHNDAINRVNLHTGILALAQGAGSIFVLAYLVTSGVLVPAALLVQAGIVAGRFVLRPLLLPLAIRFGLKPLLIAGTMISAAQYPVLAEVHGIGPALAILCVVSGIGELCYYLSYNAYFAAMGDAEHRGHQIGAREALANLIGIVAPLAGAAAIVTAGPRVAFAGVALVQLIAVIPLLKVPNVIVAREALGAFRFALLGAAISASDGFFDAGFIWIWQIALFVTLHQSFSAFGGAMALAGIAGAIYGLIAGRRLDRGDARRAVVIGATVLAAIVALRAAAFGWPGLALIANAFGALLGPLVLPASKATYNLAQHSPCPLRYHMATEAGWDIGGFIGAIIAATMITLGAPLSAALLISLPALALWTAILWRFYSPSPPLGGEGRGEGAVPSLAASEETRHA